MRKLYCNEIYKCIKIEFLKVNCTYQTRTARTFKCDQCNTNKYNMFSVSRRWIKIWNELMLRTFYISRNKSEEFN